MADPNPMFLKKPFSLKEYSNLFGHGDRPRKMAQMVELMKFDYFFKFFDFEEDTINAAWTTSVTAGGGPTAFAANAQRTGAVRGATGTTDNDVTTIHYDHAMLDAGDNPFMIIRFKAPANVSDFAFEVGFSDPPTNANVQNIDDIDTPSLLAGTTEAVVVAMDTDQTLKTAALVGVGTNSTIAKTNIWTTNGGSTGWTPTASKWIEMVIGVRQYEGYATIWDNGVAVAQGTTWRVAAGPESGVLVRPYALFMTRSTTTKQIDIDFIGFGSERNAT